MYDGIDINAPAAVVQIERVRVTNVYGSYSSMHADVVQTWGGVAVLRIDHLSADGDYQGLNLAPDIGRVGQADIENVDLTLDAVPSALATATIGSGHLIWLTRGANSCDAAPVTFRNVFVRSLGTVPAPNLIWPQAHGTSLPCKAVMSGTVISWPTLPGKGICHRRVWNLRQGRSFRPVLSGTAKWVAKLKEFDLTKEIGDSTEDLGARSPQPPERVTSRAAAWRAKYNTRVEGGHNVVLVGGSVVMPSSANQHDNGYDTAHTGIYARDATGVVHIEVVAISAEPNVMFDGIDLNAMATIEIENVCISGVDGSSATINADAVQDSRAVASVISV